MSASKPEIHKDWEKAGEYLAEKISQYEEAHDPPRVDCTFALSGLVTLDGLLKAGDRSDSLYEQIMEG